MLHAPDICFNISHTEGLVACMIDERPVGIDVERIRPFREPAMRKICSGEEIDWILGKRESERTEEYVTGIDKRTDSGRTEMDFRFFSVWTMKESYGKALGAGLAMPMKELIFFEGETGKMKRSVPGWCFRQWNLGEWILSVCLQQNTKSKTTIPEIMIPKWEEITIWEEEINEF